MAKNIIEYIIDADDKASKKMGGVTASVLKMGKATAVATAATFAFTLANAKSIDKVTKFASRIGVTTQNLSTYQHAADLAGISNEQFNMSVQRMTRRVAEASKGMGEATSALAELGIDAVSFKNIGLDKQMEVLSDRFSGMTSESDRLRLAFKLFDSEGTSMLQMLGQGSEAMQKAAADAKFLGLEVDEVASARSADFVDSMTRMWGSVKGFSRGVSTEMMPALTFMANGIADAIATARPIVVGFVQDLMSGLLTAGIFISDITGKISDLIVNAFTGEPNEALNLLSKNIQSFWSWAGDTSLEGAIVLGKAIIFGLQAVGDSLIATGEWLIDALWAGISGGDVPTIGDLLFERIPEATQAARDNLSGAFSEISSFASSTYETVSSTMDNIFGESLENAKSQSAAMIMNMQSVFEKSKEVGDQAIQETATFSQELATINAEYLATLGTQAHESAQLIHDTTQTMISGLGTAIADVLVDGGSLMDNLKILGKQVISQLIAGYITMKLQRALFATANVAATKSENTANVGAAVSQAATNAFAWQSAIFPPLAPAMAAQATIGATQAAIGGYAAGSGLGLVAHGGYTNIPDETSMVITTGGERIVSPRQNRDLTAALEGGRFGGGQGVIIENIIIEVLPNATSADSLLALSDVEMEEVVAGPIINALDSLSKRGVQPEYVGG